MESKTVRCRMCKRVLTSLDAKQAGLGPVCYRKVTGKALPRARAAPDGVKRSKPRRRNGVRLLMNQITIYDLMQEEADVTNNQQTAC